MPFIGTNTGKALTYAGEVMLSMGRGRRKGAQAVIIVVTDGKSLDDVTIPAQKLRSKGIKVFQLFEYSSVWILVTCLEYICQCTVISSWALEFKFIANTLSNVVNAFWIFSKDLWLSLEWLSALGGTKSCQMECFIFINKIQQWRLSLAPFKLKTFIAAIYQTVWAKSKL